MKTEILYEDNSILVIRKQAGLAVQSAGIGQADVVSELKSHLAKLPGAGRPGKGEPYLGIVDILTARRGILWITFARKVIWRWQ